MYLSIFGEILLQKILQKYPVKFIVYDEITGVIKLIHIPKDIKNLRNVGLNSYLCVFAPLRLPLGISKRDCAKQN